MMELGGHEWVIDQGQDEVRPEDWVDRNSPRQPPAWSKQFLRKGDDAKPNHGVDTVDIALIATHGGYWGRSEDYGGPLVVIGFNQPPGRIGTFQMRLGNGRLKWLIINACHSLETEDDPKGTNPYNIWYRSFDGLHAIFGFNGTVTDVWWEHDRGACFAAPILPWDRELADAWLDSKFGQRLRGSRHLDGSVRVLRAEFGYFEAGRTQDQRFFKPRIRSSSSRRARNR
jgi:hypothetical protein